MMISLVDARQVLGYRQRDICKLAYIYKIVLTQTMLSNMETGRLPIALDYSAWLGEQVLNRYRRVADMPVGILAECIRNREEI